MFKPARLFGNQTESATFDECGSDAKSTAMPACHSLAHVFVPPAELVQLKAATHKHTHTHKPSNNVLVLAQTGWI